MQVLRFFSYEHFYVIYCKFWELDTDHDLQLERDDLLRYGSHGLTYRAVDRVFAGAGRPLRGAAAGRMSYEDFCWCAQAYNPGQGRKKKSKTSAVARAPPPLLSTSFPSKATK